MKVTMKTRYCSPSRTVHPGKTADFPEEEARRLIAGGYAVGGEQSVKTRSLRESMPKRKRAAAKKTTSGKAAEGGAAGEGGAGEGGKTADGKSGSES